MGYLSTDEIYRNAQRQQENAILPMLLEPFICDMMNPPFYRHVCGAHLFWHLVVDMLTHVVYLINKIIKKYLILLQCIFLVI